MVLHPRLAIEVPLSLVVLSLALGVRLVVVLSLALGVLVIVVLSLALGVLVLLVALILPLRSVVPLW
jgi:hypothetical protein